MKIGAYPLVVLACMIWLSLLSPLAAQTKGETEVLLLCTYTNECGALVHDHGLAACPSGFFSPGPHSLEIAFSENRQLVRDINSDYNYGANGWNIVISEEAIKMSKSEAGSFSISISISRLTGRYEGNSSQFYSVGEIQQTSVGHCELRKMEKKF